MQCGRHKLSCLYASPTLSTLQKAKSVGLISFRKKPVYFANSRSEGAGVIRDAFEISRFDPAHACKSDEAFALLDPCSQ